MEKARLSLIFSPEDISRISITVSDMGCTEVVVDVHGMKCCEARRLMQIGKNWVAEFVDSEGNHIEVYTAVSQ